MGDDLQLSVGNRYSLISMIVRGKPTVALVIFLTRVAQFFVPYLLLQIPANLALRKFGPVIWMPSIALTWGALTIGMGFTNTWGALLGCRILMGILEVYSLSWPRSAPSRIKSLLISPYRLATIQVVSTSSHVGISDMNRRCDSLSSSPLGC